MTKPLQSRFRDKVQGRSLLLTRSPPLLPMIAHLKGLGPSVRTQTKPSTKVNEASYTVQYTGTPEEQGATVSIRVRVDLTTAAADDFNLPALDSSAVLVDAITGGTPTPSTRKTARVDLTLDASGNASFSIVLPIMDDLTPEGEETFTVTLLGQTIGTTITTPTATTTIAASDLGTWAISTTTPTVNEGQNASYTLQYNGPPAQQRTIVSILVTVGFPAQNQAMANDFDADPSTEEIQSLTSANLANLIGPEATDGNTGISARIMLTTDANGDASTIITLPIADDTTPEGNETFMVTLSEPSSGTTLTPNQDTVNTTIATNDMTPGGMWTIRTTTLTVNEGDDASYTVQYNGSADEQGSTISIQVSINLGTELDEAMADDFDDELTSATLTDAISSEEFRMQGGTATASTAMNEISAIVELTIDENGNANFRFDLTVFDDTQFEQDESFMVTLAEETPRTTFTTQTVTTTIAASDLAGTWAITPENQTVNENESARYTVQYNGDSAAQDLTVSILVTVDLGTAEPEDFNPNLTSANLATVIEENLTGDEQATADPNGISARVTLTTDGNGNASTSFNLRIADDEIPEEDEIFTVTIARPSAGTIPTNQNNAITTIAISDLGGTWAISTTTPTVNEGNPASYTVQYTGSTNEQSLKVSILVTVDLTTAEAEDFTSPLVSARLATFIRAGLAADEQATADPNGISARVTLTTDANGNASTSFELPIEDDTTQEGEETFTVTLAEPSGGSSVSSNEAVTTTIDASDISGTWDINQTSTDPVNENQNASYTVQYTTTADSAEQGTIVSILVTVELTNGQAVVEDFDADPDRPGMQPLTSVRLANLIGPEATPLTEISARIDLTTDANGNASASFELLIFDDQSEEGNEIFTVSLSEETTGTSVTTRTTTTTIAANDPSGTWTITSTTPTVNEGQNASYTVRYNGNPVTQDVTVSILVTVDLDTAEAEDFTSTLTSAELASAISGGTEIPGNDIRAMVTLTIAVGGNASVSFMLPILDEDIQEGEETFTVTLSDPSGQTTLETPDNAITTIAASDISGTWAISQTPTEPVNEGGTVNYNVQYTIGDNTNAEQGTIVSIVVAVELTNGQAQANDFESNLTSESLATLIREQLTGDEQATPVPNGISAQLSLPTDANGNASASFDLSILEEQIEEGEESFTVTLSEETTGTSVTTRTTTTTIAANDLTGTWNITSTTPTVNERQPARYTVQYNGNRDTQGSTISILVSVEFTSDQAMAEDFEPTLNSANLTAFIRSRLTGDEQATPGPTGISARVALTIAEDGTANVSFALPIADDTTEEGEETFTVTLAEPSGDSNVSTDTVTTAIAASDLTLDGTWEIDISSSTTLTVEEGGVSVYQVRYNGSPEERGETVSILVSVNLDTAQAEDFNPTLNSADLVSEINEGIRLGLPRFVGTATDGPSGISATVEITLDMDGNAVFQFQLDLEDDIIPEGEETFTVNLSQPSAGRITTPNVTTSIADNDMTWAIIPDNATVNENEAASYTVQYTTNNSANSGQSVSILVTVEFTTGQAQANDFIPLLNSAALVSAISGGTIVPTIPNTEINARVTLTIAADGNASARIVLPILDDETQEEEEIFTVTLSAQSEGRIPTPTVTTTIAASDTGGTWAISQNPGNGRVNESDTVTYNVQYDGEPASQNFPVSILVTITLDNAAANDFNGGLTSDTLSAAIIGGTPTAVPSGISARVQLNIGEDGSASFSFDLTIDNDREPEGEETFTVTLSQPSGDSSVSTDTVTTTIAPNDSTPSGTWTIRTANPTVNEGDNASYTVQYTGTPEEQRETVSILVRVRLSSADPEDFDVDDPDTAEIDTLTSATLANAINEENPGIATNGNEISAMVALMIEEDGNAIFSFDLSILEDPVFEPEETFTVRLANQSEGTTIQTRAVNTTIAANQLSGTWDITQDTNTPVNEGETVTYTVQYTRGSPAEQGARVSIQITVEFTGENPAAAEDVNPFLNPANLRSAILAAAEQAQGTEITAGNIGTPPTGGLSVAFSISESQNASFSFELTIVDDPIFELEETFTVTLSQPSGGTITTDTATTMIAPNDREGTWTITPETTTVNEGEMARYEVRYTGALGPLEMLVTLDLSGANTADVEDFDAEPNTPGTQTLNSASLANAIIGGTPTAGPSGISAVVALNVLAAGSRSFKIDLGILDDVVLENAETFTIRVAEQLRDPTQAPVEAITTIDTSDLRGTWEISTTTTTVNEGQNASYTVQYTNDPNTQRTQGTIVSILVRVALTTAENNDFDPTLTSAALVNAITAGTGATDVDLGTIGISAMVSLTTDANGDARASFNLPIVDDTDPEGEETFTVTITDTDQIIGTTIDENADTATTTIAASDLSGTWDISQTSTTPVNEDESASYTVQYNSTSAERGLTVSILVTVEFTGDDPAQANDFDPPLTSENLATLIRERLTGDDQATADPNGISARISLTTDASGDASTSFDLPIENDPTQEGEETFTVTLAEPSGGSSVSSNEAVTTTIAANDTPPTGTWAITTITPVNEGQNARYIVRYTGSTADERGATVSILVTVTFGTAMADDFDVDPDTTGIQLLTSAALVDAISVETATARTDISAMVTLTLDARGNARFFFNLPIANDPTQEEDETVTATLSEPSGNTMLNPALTSATTTIAASDSGGWGILGRRLNMNEGTSINTIIRYQGTETSPSILVTLSGLRFTVTRPTGGVTPRPVGSATADDFDAEPENPETQPLNSERLAAIFERINGVTAVAVDSPGAIGAARVTITPRPDTQGNTDFLFSLRIAADNDNTEGPELLSINLSNPMPAESIFRGPVFAGTQTIKITDVLRRTWDISPTDQTVVEGQNASYTVQYRGRGGDTASILVTVDLRDTEADDDFNPSLTSDVLASAINAGTVTGGENRTAEPITTGTEISARVVINPGPSGNQSFSFELPISSLDGMEGDETFTVTLSEQNPETTITTARATTTIADSDIGGNWAINQTSTDPVNEGQNASYTVRYVNAANSGQSGLILVTVEFTSGQAQAHDFNPTLTSEHLATLIGDRATPGDTGISAIVELTIGADGNASNSFDLTIRDEAIRESAETFTVTLSQPSAGMITPNQDNVTTTIAASDVIPEGMWTITPDNQTVNEEDESASYTVEYNGSVDEQGLTVSILVEVGFTGVNPAAANDFDGDPDMAEIQPLTSASLATVIQEDFTGAEQATPGTTGISAMVELTIDASGNASASFDLPIEDDPTHEGEETFTVTLSEQSDRTILAATNRVTTTIAASDREGTWAISTENPTFNEDQTASYTVQYNSSAAAEQGATVSILVTVELTLGQAQANDFNPTLTSATLRDAISGGTATLGPSEISAMVVLNIGTSGNASFVVALPIADDPTPEGEETFMVTLSEENTGTTISTDTVTTTIAANDTSPSGTWTITLRPNVSTKGTRHAIPSDIPVRLESKEQLSRSRSRSNLQETIQQQPMISILPPL